MQNAEPPRPPMLPRARCRWWRPPSASTACGSAAPSSPPSPPSSRCGSPRASTTSPAPPSCTGVSVCWGGVSAGEGRVLFAVGASAGGGDDRAVGVLGECLLVTDGCRGLWGTLVPAGGGWAVPGKGWMFTGWVFTSEARVAGLAGWVGGEWLPGGRVYRPHLAAAATHPFIPCLAQPQSASERRGAAAAGRRGGLRTGAGVAPPSRRRHAPARPLRCRPLPCRGGGGTMPHALCPPALFRFSPGQP